MNVNKGTKVNLLANKTKNPSDFHTYTPLLDLSKNRSHCRLPQKVIRFVTYTAFYRGQKSRFSNTKKNLVVSSGEA